MEFSPHIYVCGLEFPINAGYFQTKVCRQIFWFTVENLWAVVGGSLGHNWGGWVGGQDVNCSGN